MDIQQVILDFEVPNVDGLLNGQVSTKTVFTVILFTFVNLIYTSNSVKEY